MKKIIVAIISIITLSASIINADVYSRPKGDSRFRDLSLARQPLPSAELDNEFNIIKNFFNNTIFTTTQNISEWALFQNTPTYVSTSRFTVMGNSTDLFMVGRAIKAELANSFVYSKVASSTFDSLTNKTTVTLYTEVLHSSLYRIYYGLINSDGKSQPDGKKINVSIFSSFSAAKTNPITSGKTIVISSEVSVNTATVARDRTIEIERGGSINIASGHILTMPPPVAGRYRIKNGSGTLKLYSGRVFPEWFANNEIPGTTDMTTEINLAINALGTSSQSPGIIDFDSSLAYLTSGPIRVRGGQKLLNPTIVSTSTTNIIESADSGTIYNVVIDNANLTSSTAAVGINMEGINNSTLNSPRVNMSAPNAIGLWLKHGLAARQCYFNSVINPMIYAGETSGTAVKIEGTSGVSGSNAHSFIGGKLSGFIGIHLLGYGINPSTRNSFFGTQLENVSSPVVTGSIGVNAVGSGYNTFIGVDFERWATHVKTDTASPMNAFYRPIASGAAFIMDDASTSTIIDYSPDINAQTQIIKKAFLTESNTRYGGSSSVSYDTDSPVAANSPIDVSWFRTTAAGSSNGGGTSWNIYAPNTANINLGVASANRSGAWEPVITWLGNYRITYGNSPPTRGVWAVGDRRYQSAPAVGSPKGWICTGAGGAYGYVRADSTAYTLNNFAKWSTGTSIWEATTAGTTAGTAPDIAGKGVGDTVVDGTVTWTMRSLVTNVWVSEGNL